jgi:hypothetical protein
MLLLRPTGPWCSGNAPPCAAPRGDRLVFLLPIPQLFPLPHAIVRGIANLLVTACWASAGYSTAGCQQVELALRNCMDAPAAPPTRTSEINYHLGRFQTRVAGKKRP